MRGGLLGAAVVLVGGGIIVLAISARPPRDEASDQAVGPTAPLSTASTAGADRNTLPRLRQTGASAVDSADADEASPVPPPDNSAPRDIRAQRELLAQRLSQSGPADGDWARQALRTFDTGSSFLQALGGEVRVRRTECYRDGCLASIQFEDLATQSRGVEALAKSQILMDWPGAKIITGPDLQDDSTVVSDWILFRPTE